MSHREILKGRIQSSVAEVHKINNCAHLYIYRPVLYYGYLPADWWCSRCGTFARSVEQEEEQNAWRLAGCPRN